MLPTLAVRLGLNEAIAVQQLHFAMQTFESRIVTLDDASWLRADLSFWEGQFPWWSERTIRRVWTALRDLGVVHTSRGSEANVYRIDYMKLDEVTGQIDPSQRTHCPPATGQVDLSLPIGEGTAESLEEEQTGGPAALFDPPPSPASADEPDIVHSAENIRKVWAHYVTVFEPKRQDLSTSRENLIRKALKETGSVELTCRAIDGLKSWRKAKPGDTSLSAIFTTRPGGSALGDQIEWWAAQAEEQRGFDVSRVPSVMRATVNSQRAQVRRGLDSDDEHAQRMGREAAEWLAERYKIVPVIESGELKGWRYED